MSRDPYDRVHAELATADGMPEAPAPEPESDGPAGDAGTAACA